MSDVFISRWR